MATGILGKKIGMTSVFRDGNSIPVTVVEAGPCTVVQVKNTDGADNYDALQLGFLPKNEKRLNKPEAGHFAGAGVKPFKVLREFRGMTGHKAGQEVNVNDLFSEGEIIDVRGRSKGRGFAGVMKRHGFHGGKASHGVHEIYRGTGSIGACATPSRVWKGKKMPGRFGNATVSVKNLQIIEIIADRNLVLVKGAVPGAKNSIVELCKRKG
ncbi:MAG: 50S ribosomal protein L3 [Candidatus Electryonea clarkiae]|nr:50S ribosomal protein L3 [Candidatus Electryonea clarkiae]MDP8288627.1 50S ribosomal protein L3 [Candidatus Electryonea clarkiae]